MLFPLWLPLFKIKIGLIGKDAKDAVPALIIALQDQDRSVRSNSADALGKIGNDSKDAVPALMTTLRDKIGKDAKDAVPELTEIFLDDDEYVYVRYQAIQALKQIGSDEAILILEKNKEITNAISKSNRKDLEISCPIGYSCLMVTRVRTAITTNIKNKPPLICKIPQIKAMLHWKCP